MKGLKNIFILYLKVLKYLFYDSIPEFYDIKWYKKDFDSKLEYYYFLPIRYILLLVMSLLDPVIMICRIIFIIGVIKGVLSSVKTSK